MVDFVKIFANIERLRRILNRQQAIIQKIRLELEKEVKKLDTACMPSCVEAVNEYNSLRTRLFILREFITSFDLTKNKIYLSVQLAYQNKNEPYEDLETDDVKKIESALRPILDKKLKRKNIPLSFGKLVVPTSYYGK